MTTIGGPGGIGGPRGPNGPAGLDGTDDLEQVAGDATIEQAPSAVPTAPTGNVEALVAELAAGRLTPQEVVDQLLAATADPGLDASERAELRELLSDLVANDPYLGNLIGRL